VSQTIMEGNYMMISTKGRYAIRALAELAKYKGDEYIPLKVISEKQNISRKYLEAIMLMLVQNNLVSGASGKKGGYRLNKSPNEITLGEVLRITEGGLEPVACISEHSEPCYRVEECHSFPVWQGLYDVINDYLDSKTIIDVMENGYE